jgi:hypothetical protein
MISNRLQPLLWRFGIGRPAAKVIGVFPSSGFFLRAGLATHMQNGLDMRKLYLERIDRFQSDLTVGFAAVFFVEPGKKGGRPAKPASAKARTVFWLSFT